VSETAPEYESGYFETRFAFNPERDVVWQEVARYLQAREISETSAILELGAGYCHFINNIRGRERHALDVSRDLPRHVVAGVTAHVGSCSSLSMFPDRSLDVVFASNLFEHLTRDELSNALREIWRVLADHGRLIIVQPNFKYCAPDYFDDYTHVQVFTHVSLSDLLRARGFQVARVVPRFLPFSMSSRLPKLRWLIRMYLRSPFRPFGAQMLIVAHPARNGKPPA
jgi:ubiquinone/menaquinone biosynthesis C-methylase UbiE